MMDEYNEAEIFAYLEELRESGETNMFGAAPYLENEFGMTRNESKTWLRRWMDSYKQSA